MSSNFEQYSNDALRTVGEGKFLEMSQIVDELHVEELKRPNMPLEAYIEFIDRLKAASAKDEHKVGLMYDALGLAGEAGEVADYMKKVFGHGKKFDPDHVEKELGDILWYINRMTRRLGKSLIGVAQKNIAKLKARYPQGFSHEASENRKE